MTEPREKTLGGICEKKAFLGILDLSTWDLDTENYAHNQQNFTA